jgi:hypothetical protein
MSSQTTVTMSLVRLMMTRYDTEIKKLLTRTHELQNEASFSKRQLGGDLEEIQTAFRDTYDEYFPDEFYDFCAFVIAEFLDPRTISLIEQAGIQLFKKSVQALLLPSEVEVQKPAATSGRRRGATATEGVPSGTGAAAAAEHLRANQTLSEFDTQLNRYLRVMSNLKTEELMAYDPHICAFGAAISCSCPHFVQCNFFSVVGRICSPLRPRLVAEMLEALSCLHGWKREELNYADARTGKRTKIAERFATLSISMDLIPGVAGEDELEEDLTEDMAMDEMDLLPHCDTIVSYCTYDCITHSCCSCLLDWPVVCCYLSYESY